MKKFLVMVFAASVSVCALAESGKDTFKAMVERALTGYAKKGHAEAIRSLPKFSTARTEEEQRQQIAKFVAWKASTSEKRGAALGYKFESSKTVSDVVTRLSYAVLGERGPWSGISISTGLDRIVSGNWPT